MYEFVSRLVPLLKKVVPERVVQFFRPAYHRFLIYLMAFSYGFPARELVVIGVTGTKGKSTVAEMVFAILQGAGYRTALISTIRFAIGDSSEPNRFKMTLQGRGFAQAFMRKAISAGCTHIVVEITSESVLQHRHRFLDLDALIVTNIQREHIERHGSFGKYVAAKHAIVGMLARSPKSTRILVVNGDVPETHAMLSARVSRAIEFGMHDLRNLTGDYRSIHFVYANVPFSLPIAGTFNALNALAAIKLCEAFCVPLATAAAALERLPTVRGRVEHIDAGQEFLVIIDYAHTPDSLAALYSAFPTHRKICVLGNTGGGRDQWKRPEMGRIASEACAQVILTNEDPYDEDPRRILEDMSAGMSVEGRRFAKIILDRREAIRAAFRAARPGDAVLISGKGTDPYIMGAHDTKMPWSDATVAREELEKLLRDTRAAR